MAFADRMVLELERRTALLPKELTTLRAAVEANLNDFGIHRSQVIALTTMMDELEKRQKELLKQFKPTLEPESFADIYKRLEQEVVGSHDVWRVFRYIMGQWRDEPISDLVDAADLIAADCYLTCMRKVEDWGIMQAKEFREPPLVYFEAEDSPATASRGRRVELLRLSTRQYRLQELPIPVVQLPFHHAECIWLYCTLHHEVGHNLDQDIRVTLPNSDPLTLTTELKRKIGERLEQAGVDLDQRRVWQKWTGEMLADVCGVLLGGAGFAQTLASILFLQAPLADTVNTAGVHPDDWVRVALICELLRRCKIPSMTSAADAIMQQWNAYTKPTTIDAYIAVVPAIAEVLLDAPLDVLQGTPAKSRSMHAFGSDLVADETRVAKLVTFLLTGFQQPEPKNFPWRLVPPAAQLAFLQLQPLDKQALVTTQERALKHLNDIPRPQFLGSSQEATIRRLARGLTFGADEEDSA